MPEEALGNQSYDERMDRMLSQLRAAAAESQKRYKGGHVGYIVVAGLVAVFGIAIYLIAVQSTAGGDLMHFLADKL